MEHNPDRSEIDLFLFEQIETVPHLEALLLLWNSRPKLWSADDMAKALFLPPEPSKSILEDLARQRLIVSVAGPLETYRYEQEPDRDKLLTSVAATYRRELIRVSRLIHSKPSAAVRAFARAFQLKKDRE